jgi:hypothetical protein
MYFPCKILPTSLNVKVIDFWAHFGCDQAGHRITNIRRNFVQFRTIAMYSMGGIAIIVVAVLFVIGMDKLWFRIMLAVLFLFAIAAIAYFGGSRNI